MNRARAHPRANNDQECREKKNDCIKMHQRSLQHATFFKDAGKQTATRRKRLMRDVLPLALTTCRSWQRKEQNAAVC